MILSVNLFPVLLFIHIPYNFIPLFLIVKNWQTILKLVLAGVAAVITYVVANRIINKIMDTVDTITEAEIIEESEPLDSRIIDPKDIADEKTVGGNGQDVKDSEKTSKKV